MPSRIERSRIIQICEYTLHLYFFISFRYNLQATINHEGDHFTSTLLGFSNQLFLFHDLKGIQKIKQSLSHVETAVYVLKP